MWKYQNFLAGMFATRLRNPIPTFAPSKSKTTIIWHTNIIIITIITQRARWISH